MALLLCDLDDTLLDRAAVFGEWATAFAASHGGGAPDDVAWLVEQDRDGYCERDDLFEAVRARFGLADTAADLVTAFYQDFLPRFVFRADVRAALAAVRRHGWRIAVVTNGSASQERKIVDTGLARYVDAWCVSGIEGIRKPDPALLELAAARCGEPLAGAWVVGDAPLQDVGAAHAAGIPSIWLRRGRSWPREDYAPTLEAGSFPEAVDLLLTNSGRPMRTVTPGE